MDYLKTSKCVPFYRKLGGAKVLTGSLEDARYVGLLHIMDDAGLFLFPFVVSTVESGSVSLIVS
jgi:hypothetical protein